MDKKTRQKKKQVMTFGFKQEMKSGLLCQQDKFMFVDPSIHPGLLPMLFTLRHLTSYFALVMIATTARGRLTTKRNNGS